MNMKLAASVERQRSSNMADRYWEVRAQTEALCVALAPEDQVVQSMPDASPAKWHRAHTTWFFETFLLGPHMAGYRAFDPAFGFLFNSYYEAVGARHPRAQRGLLTRPDAHTVAAYRAHVDAAMTAMLGRGVEREVAALVELGLQHEQQHQELLLMDILHAFAQNPLRPAYAAHRRHAHQVAPPLSFIDLPGGTVEIGHDGDGFAFDNEGPRHPVLLPPYALANRLVTNAEWLSFMADDGYRRPELWLADGWAMARREGWEAPLYWEPAADGCWHAMGLSGLRPVELSAPVVHVSYYEADAYARWAGHRLPTEAEWEAALAISASGAANDLGSGLLRPVAPSGDGDGLLQMLGDA